MAEIVKELQRRNVFRVALLYLVASWLIIQVADVGVSLLDLPAWTGRMIFLLLAIGFPLVLIFSWAYEITPEGLKKEKEVERSQSITDETAKKLNTAVIVLLILALVALALDRYLPGTAPTVETSSTATTTIPDRSIAVLPFVNRSSDEENQYFSDGLTEELQALLARIPELKVAASTSSFALRDSGADVSEIALKLGVAHILEGGVRKSGDQLRISARLIKADDGFQLWSGTWDKTMTDVFDIQNDIAEAVVEELRITLAADVPKAQWTDPSALDLYLRSKVPANRNTVEGFEEATRLLVQALAIDPDYADAWAQLAIVQVNQAGQKALPPKEAFERAKDSAQRALNIDPQNDNAMALLAWVAMYWDWDFPRAGDYIRRARDISPGSASVANTYAGWVGHFGRHDAALEIYREALQADATNMAANANLTALLINMNRLDEAALQIEAMQAVDPETEWIAIMSGWLALRRGDAQKALDEFSTITGAYRDWGEIFAYHDLGLAEKSDAALQRMIEQARAPHPYQVASAYSYRGETDLAFEWLERAYDERDDWLIELRNFYVFESLHADPRWNALVNKLGLSDAHAEAVGL